MAMKISQQKFNERLSSNLENDFMRGAVAGAQHRFQTRRSAAVDPLDWEEWRNHGEEIRQHVLENLDYYLYELSTNVEARGGHVFFAQTAEEALYHDNGKCRTDSSLPKRNVRREVERKQQTCNDGTQVVDSLFFLNNKLKQCFACYSGNNTGQNDKKCIETEQDHTGDCCREKRNDDIQHNAGGRHLVFQMRRRYDY